MKLRDKILVVTGAGGGIGRALVLDLLRRGAGVAAVDLNGDRLRETQLAAGATARLSLHTLDITDRAATAQLPDAVVDAHGMVDGLINNAGVIQPFTPFNALDFEVIDRMIAVNLGGTINMTKAFLPHLLARPEAHLVNVASMGGFMPFPGQSLYGVAKAGVKLLTEALYAELAGTSVAVSVALPGAVATEITRNSGVDAPGGRDTSNPPAFALSAERAAAIVLDGMVKGRLHILVGRDARALFALWRVAPRRSIQLINKQVDKALNRAG